MKNRTDNIRTQRSSSSSPLTIENTRPPGQPRQTPRIPGWVLLPLRLFLGITFIYAGIQKLTNPQYFRPSAAGYIGKQIAALATGSPIHNFLIQVALPHATLFGALTAYGELAIGLGTLIGLLLRPAAFFGLLLNLLFFLSATWRVYPYFYGSDIVFIFCWITLLLNGPANTGFPALDVLLVPRLLSRVSPTRQERLAPVLQFFLGVGKPTAPDSIQPIENQGKQSPGRKRTPQQSRYAMARQAKESRRNFLLGILTGGAGMLGLVWIGSILHIIPQAANTASPPDTSATGTPDLSGTAASGSTPGTSTTIAQVSAVPSNSSVSFTITSNSDPGVLVHLKNGQFVAYDAVCTHAGCPVDYDPSSQLLLCPCHGAAFDPAKGAAVVQGPANTPLAQVSIHVDNASGTITQ